MSSTPMDWRCTFPATFENTFEVQNITRRTQSLEVVIDMMTKEELKEKFGYELKADEQIVDFNNPAACKNTRVVWLGFKGQGIVIPGWKELWIQLNKRLYAEYPEVMKGQSGWIIPKGENDWIDDNKCDFEDGLELYTDYRYEKIISVIQEVIQSCGLAENDIVIVHNTHKRDLVTRTEAKIGRPLREEEKVLEFNVTGIYTGCKPRLLHYQGKSDIVRSWQILFAKVAEILFNENFSEEMAAKWLHENYRVSRGKKYPGEREIVVNKKSCI